MSDTAPVEVTDTAAGTAPVAENTTWRDSLSEDIRENATLAKYKDIESLASAHINLQSHMGRDKIAKPVTDEDWNNVYDFMGRPESADAYQININDELPDQVKGAFDNASIANFKEQAHKLGLNANQAQGLIDFYANNLSGQFSAMEASQGESLAEAEKALSQEWGQAYEQNVSFAKKAFAEYGGDELAELMDSSGLGNHPAVLKAFANIAKSTMSDKELVGPTNTRGEALTPQEAKDKASEIMANPAYMDKNHPEHKKLVREVTTLFEKAYS